MVSASLPTAAPIFHSPRGAPTAFDTALISAQGTPASAHEAKNTAPSMFSICAPAAGATDRETVFPVTCGKSPIFAVARYVTANCGGTPSNAPSSAAQVDPNNPNYESEDGVLFNKGKTRIVYYPSGRPGSYVLPETVEEIGANVFFNNDIAILAIF